MAMLKCGLLEHLHMCLVVVVMLLTATFAPVVLADVKWEEDGWLATIGSERLEMGDEFGCYGMPNLSWKADPGAVALECGVADDKRTRRNVDGTAILKTEVQRWMSHRATCRKRQEVSPSQENSKFYRNSSTYVAGCLVADKRAVMNLDFGA